MARSHHRKKHKQHLRQFQHSHDIKEAKTKGNAALIFLIAGAIVGFAIAFFASGAAAWVAIGAAIGAAAGFIVGKRLDREK